MKVLASLGVAVAIAAGAAAQSQTETPPSFKAGVELVRLDVRVTDADGRPVRDLKSSEIEIVEDGQVRPLLFFHHVEEPPDSLVDVTKRTVASEVSTNQGAARGHLYVLVFDQGHITPGNEQRARQAAQRFLTTRMRTGDRVAAYAIPGPGPDIGFTADARHVAAELERVRGLQATEEVGVLGTMSLHEAVQITRGDETTLQRVSQRIQQQSAGTDVARGGTSAGLGTDSMPLTRLVQEDARTIVNRADDQARRTLTILADILRPMRDIEGRKTIIFISEGFYADRITRDIDEVAAAAAQSYSVIYAIDINRRDLDIKADAPVGPDQFTSIQDRLTPLGGLAAETGGELVNDASPQAARVFDALAEQSQDYYLVGFAPLQNAMRARGTYRPVSVRVTRRGAHVSTRTGFSLIDPASRLPRREVIDRALKAPFAQQGLPVQYTTYVLRGVTAGQQRVILSLSAQLPVGSPTQTRPADVVFAVRSMADGHVAASGTDVIALPRQADGGATTGTGTYRVQFDLPAGDYLMRAVVREPDGLVGSADRRFTVRALDGPAVTSGDLVLSGQKGELPVRPAAYTGDGLSGILDVYGRTPEQLENIRVRVDLLPFGEQAATISGDADLQEPRMVGSGAAREARIELPLQAVTPGAYLARASVKSGAETVAEVVREIEVRSGQRPAIATEARSFDPKDVVGGSFAREYSASLARESAVSRTDASRGLERLAAADYPAAIAALQARLRESPDDGRAAFFLGWAFHGAGDDRQAISSWRTAAYLDPKAVPAHLALADIYVQLGQPALAVQALRAGLTALPQSPELLDRLAGLGQKP